MSKLHTSQRDVLFFFHNKHKGLDGRQPQIKQYEQPTLRTADRCSFPIISQHFKCRSIISPTIIIWHGLKRQVKTRQREACKLPCLGETCSSPRPHHHKRDFTWCESFLGASCDFGAFCQRKVADGAPTRRHHRWKMTTAVVTDWQLFAVPSTRPASPWLRETLTTKGETKGGCL